MHTASFKTIFPILQHWKCVLSFVLSCSVSCADCFPWMFVSLGAYLCDKKKRVSRHYLSNKSIEKGPIRKIILWRPKWNSRWSILKRNRKTTETIKIKADTFENAFYLKEININIFCCVLFDPPHVLPSHINSNQMEWFREWHWNFMKFLRLKIFGLYVYVYDYLLSLSVPFLRCTIACLEC